MPFDPSCVRAEMARRRVTIERLSELTSLGTSSIEKILSPDGNPTARSISQIATALQVHEGSFFAPVPHYSVGSVALSPPGVGNVLPPVIPF